MRFIFNACLSLFLIVWANGQTDNTEISSTEITTTTEEPPIIWNEACGLADHPYMTNLVRYDTYVFLQEFRYEVYGPAVILSEYWVITHGGYLVRSGTIDTLIHDTRFDIIKPLWELYSKARTTVRASRTLEGLTLVKMSEAIPIQGNIEKRTNKTHWFGHWTVKLPPTRSFTSQCKKACLVGWPPPNPLPVSSSPDDQAIRHFNGTQKAKCDATQTEVVFTPNKYKFCFEGENVTSLTSHGGNVIVCEDDVLIGILNNSKVLEVGLYMSWIGSTTGIEVAYHSEPSTTTKTTKVFHDMESNQSTEYSGAVRIKTQTVNIMLSIILLIVL